jgi:hypothetical protein
VQRQVAKAAVCEESTGVRLLNPANATIGISVFVVLVVIIILILAFAHAWAPETTFDFSKRCFETFGTAQWPKWIGCAMAVHESLAAGLVGVAGALFAAWLAYSGLQQQFAHQGLAMQQQFAHQENERARLRAEAKEAAVTALTQTVHAAGSTFGVIREALKRQQSPFMMKSFFGRIEFGVDQLRMALDHWSLKEVAKDLSRDDRAAFLMVVLTLESIVNIDRQKERDAFHLAEQEKALTRVHNYLIHFDDDLANAYAKDAGM